MSEISLTSNEPERNADQPLLNSKDPADRKLARSQRIQRRLLNLNRSIDSNDEQKVTGPVQQSKLKSEYILGKILNEAEQNLRDTTIENISYELKRRKSEDTKRKKLLHQLKREASDAKHEFDEIMDKWKNIGMFKDPVDTRKGIVNIKERCDSLIKSRDNIMVVIKSEIAFVEKEFNIDQKKDFENLESLFKRMEKHIEAIKTSFGIQFKIVKKVINTTKDDYYREKYDNWDKLYTEITKETDALCKNKFKFLQKITDAVENTRNKFSEYFRSQKSLLMNTISTAREQFENIKAEVMINSEKYEYIFQIYYRRCNESTIMGAYQKRRITKLQDVILKLKSTIKSYKSNTKSKIKKYEANIKLIHKRILDIENKADKFSETNEKIFNEIWDLSKRNCYKLLDTIIETDKILQEQLLSKLWNQPQTFRFELSNLPSVKAASSCIKLIRRYSIEPSKIDNRKPSILPDPAPSFSSKLENEKFKKLIKHILVRTSDKAGFLSEERINILLKKYESDEKCLVTLDQLFEALRIDEEDELDLIINFFLPYSFCHTCYYGGDISQQGSFFMGNATGVSNASCVSEYISKSTGEYDAYSSSLLQQIGEALKYTTHAKISIDDVILEIVTSAVNLEEWDIESEESIDIAENDRLDLTEAKKIQRKKSMAVTRDKMLCQYSHLLSINSIYVVKALKEFVEFYYDRSKMAIPTMVTRLRNRRLTISRLIDEEDIIEYWKQWLTVLDENSRNINEWDQLTIGLHHYLDVLKQRKLLSEEVINLRKQNKRLKKIVQSYKNQVKALPPICEIQCVCVFE